MQLSQRLEGSRRLLQQASAARQKHQEKHCLQGLLHVLACTQQGHGTASEGGSGIRMSQGATATLCCKFLSLPHLDSHLAHAQSEGVRLQREGSILRSGMSWFAGKARLHSIKARLLAGCRRAQPKVGPLPTPWLKHENRLLASPKKAQQKHCSPMARPLAESKAKGPFARAYLAPVAAAVNVLAVAGQSADVVHLHTLACVHEATLPSRMLDTGVPACGNGLCASSLYCHRLVYTCTFDGLLAVARGDHFYLQTGVLVHASWCVKPNSGQDHVISLVEGGSRRASAPKIRSASHLYSHCVIRLADLVWVTP